MSNDAVFRAKAPGIMNLLQADFQLDLESAAAILGNLGHESSGFRSLQEIAPVMGGIGGYGWAQWTDSRRDLYMAYCRKHGYDPASDNANYKFLFVELKGSHRAAIPAVKNAIGLEAKVKAFELVFEKAHKDHKHYDSRNTWARIALDAYQDNPGGTIDVQDVGVADGDAPAPQPAPNTGIALPAQLAPINQFAPLDLISFIASAIGLFTKAQQPGGLQQADVLAFLQPLMPAVVAQPAPIVVPAVPVAPAPSPAKVEATKPAQGGFSLARPGVWGSLAALAGAAFGIDQGAIGGAFGLGAQPSAAGTAAVLGPLLNMGLSAAGAFVPAVNAIKPFIAAFSAARASASQAK